MTTRSETLRLELQPWCADDIAVLERANSAEMTRFLGGPEAADDLAARHAEYLDLATNGEGAMFRLEVDGESAGYAGWWAESHEGEPVSEIGCAVEPRWQGHGVATMAMRRVIAHALQTTGRPVVGYAAVVNEASNALCRRLGMQVRGRGAFRSEAGEMIVNIWVIEA